MPFEKGASGNPSGRPQGTSDRRRIVREYLVPEAPKLVSKAVEMALAGDNVMLKACLDKLIPNARAETQVNYPECDSLGHLGSDVLGLVGRGELTLEEGRAIIDLAAVQAKLQEHDELVARITALEEAADVSQTPNILT